MLCSGESGNESPYFKEIHWQPKDKHVISILQPLCVNLSSSACRLRGWELVFQSAWVGQTREQHFRQMLSSRFINSHLDCGWFLSCSPVCWGEFFCLCRATAPLLGCESSWQLELPHLTYWHEMQNTTQEHGWVCTHLTVALCRGFSGCGFVSLLLYHLLWNHILWHSERSKYSCAKFRLKLRLSAPCSFQTMHIAALSPF